MNLISIRFRVEADRTVLEFRHRLIGDDGRVSAEWGQWQIAYIIEDEKCKHTQNESRGSRKTGTRWDQIYVRGYWRHRVRRVRTSRRRTGLDG